MPKAMRHYIHFKKSSCEPAHAKGKVGGGAVAVFCNCMSQGLVSRSFGCTLQLLIAFTGPLATQGVLGAASCHHSRTLADSPARLRFMDVWKAQARQRVFSTLRWKQRCYLAQYIWRWVKNRYPKWNPGKWKHGLKYVHILVVFY